MWIQYISIVLLCVCVRAKERKEGMSLPSPHTCSCNPLCFGDLGNLVTKQSWCPFDWGHGWWFGQIEKTVEEDSRTEEEEDKVVGSPKVAWLRTVCSVTSCSLLSVHTLYVSLYAVLSITMSCKCCISCYSSWYRLNDVQCMLPKIETAGDNNSIIKHLISLELFEGIRDTLHR